MKGENSIRWLKHVLKKQFLWNVPKPTQTFLAAGSFQALISDFGLSPGCSWMLRSLTPDKSRCWERPAGVGSVVMGMRMMIIYDYMVCILSTSCV